MELSGLSSCSSVVTPAVRHPPRVRKSLRTAVSSFIHSPGNTQAAHQQQDRLQKISSRPSFPYRPFLHQPRVPIHQQEACSYTTSTQPSQGRAPSRSGIHSLHPCTCQYPANLHITHADLAAQDGCEPSNFPRQNVGTSPAPAPSQPQSATQTDLTAPAW